MNPAAATTANAAPAPTPTISATPAYTTGTPGRNCLWRVSRSDFPSSTYHPVSTATTTHGPVSGIPFHEKAVSRSRYITPYEAN
ncbi:hypothetical protein PG994_008509 [Apiospora phragmitis]|uniref:Uncharacterized protein n=1 Tax=Apiospora phragmitis TaxID=2905665 RepID=A0ABR1UGM4_9PEZI